MSPAVVDRLYKAFKAAADSDEYKKLLVQLGQTQWQKPPANTSSGPANSISPNARWLSAPSCCASLEPIPPARTISPYNSSQVEIMKSLLAAICSVFLLATTAVSANEQFPVNNVKIIVPFPAGGTTDILARFVAQYLGEKLGVTTIVENRPGASGIIGSEVVAKSPPMAACCC